MFFVEVLDLKTEKVVNRLGPMPMSRAERVEGGLNLNLNHNSYFTRISKEDQG